MDAFSLDRNELHYSDKPPILVAASSHAALERALRTVEATGARIAARLSIDEAAQRMEQQVATSAIWIELDHDCGGAMDELLASVDRDVADGRYAAVVSATPDLLDPIAAQLTDRAVEIVIGGDEAERVASLALASSCIARPLRLSDVASDRSAESLRQLSDEVSRIAATLARLSTGPAAVPAPLQQPTSADAPPVPVETVRSVIRARRLRARYFQSHLFADPAWDMLLDLLQAEISHLRVPVSSLCIAAAVPATTALRWLKTMVSEGIFIRRADPHDGRRVFVELAPEASQALRRYFADVGAVATI